MATVLKRGSKGAAVKDVQRLLNWTVLPPLEVDGDYGDKTEKVVIAFQKTLGLVPDGKVGPQTLTALKQLAASPKPGRPEPDKSAMSSPVPATVTDIDGASPPPNVSSLKLLDTAREIDEIIWHCAATPEGKDFTVDDIRSWHKQRGFSDIGYHYVIYRDGRIMLGRPVGQIGAHVEGHNKKTLGCCYIGGVSADGKTAKDTRTAAQRASALWLTDKLAKKFRVKKVKGHNEYNPGKACPSFDVRKDQLSKLAA